MTANHHAPGRRPTSPDGQHRGMAGAPDDRTAHTADDLLMEARASLLRRPSPAEALAAQARGALLIDIRGDDQRRARGLIPGAPPAPQPAGMALRPHGPVAAPGLGRPGSASHPDLPGGVNQSSLAAATLQRLGPVNATDMDGGFTAWDAAGLPVIAQPTTSQNYPVTVTPTDNHPEPG